MERGDTEGKTRRNEKSKHLVYLGNDLSEGKQKVKSLGNDMSEDIQQIKSKIIEEEEVRRVIPFTSPGNNMSG